MSLGLLFWILMIIWFAFSLWWSWPLQGNQNWPQNAFLFVLFLLLGWQVFGAPLRV